MQIVHSIPELRHALRAASRPAFVPTMGNLHAGHLALVGQAKPLGDVTVAERLSCLPLPVGLAAARLLLSALDDLHQPHARRG